MTSRDACLYNCLSLLQCLSAGLIRKLSVSMESAPVKVAVYFDLDCCECSLAITNEKDEA